MDDAGDTLGLLLPADEPWIPEHLPQMPVGISEIAGVTPRDSNPRPRSQAPAPIRDSERDHVDSRFHTLHQSLRQPRPMHDPAMRDETAQGTGLAELRETPTSTESCGCSGTVLTVAALLTQRGARGSGERTGRRSAMRPAV